MAQLNKIDINTYNYKTDSHQIYQIKKVAGRFVTKLIGTGEAYKLAGYKVFKASQALASILEEFKKRI